MISNYLREITAAATSFQIYSDSCVSLCYLVPDSTFLHFYQMLETKRKGFHLRLSEKSPGSCREETGDREKSTGCFAQVLLQLLLILKCKAG